MEKALLVKVMANADSFKKGMNDANRHLSGFQRQINQFKTMFAAAFSVAVIGNYIKTSIQGYMDQQDAEAALLEAMNGRMDAMKRLSQQASELQEKTRFGDDETIKAQATLAMMIGANESAIHKLMPAVQDMATGLKMDLNAAAQLVGKTLASSTNALARYGIQVEGVVGSSERLDSLLGNLNKKFKGQAEAAGETLRGSLVRLKNVWGDFNETLWGGEKAISNYIIAVNSLVNLFTSLGVQIKLAREESIKYGEWIEDNPNFWQRLFSGAEKDDPFKKLEKKFAKDKERASRKGTALKTGNTELMTALEADIFSDIAAEMAKVKDLKIELFNGISEYLRNRDLFGTTPWSTSGKEKSDPFANKSFDLEEEFFPDEDKMDQALVDWKNKIADFAENFNSMMQNNLSGSIISLADAFGDALATGDMEAMFNNILRILAGFLQEIGAMFVAYAVSLIAFETAWMNPAILLTAGSALIALGGGIKALTNKNPMGNPVFNEQNNLHLTSSIKGSDLKLILSRTGAQQGRF
jgi:hypothetical protein